VALARLRRTAPRIVGGIRIVNGAAALLAPAATSRRLGVDPDANQAAFYPLRLLGVRSVVLGAELLLGDERSRRRSMRSGVIIYGSDVVAAGLGGLRRQLPPRTAALLAGLSAICAALAAVGSGPAERSRWSWRWSASR
jgi:energy-converting hydrogenase Eha subunit A